jgi:membrane-bound lytic murein transglycosylase D
MARISGTINAVFLIFFISSSSLLFCQQANLQTSFLAPTAIRLSTQGSVSSIVDTEHLPYLKQVSLEKKASFSPTASDLLIERAEGKFRNGKKFFQDHDFTRARTEFDGAIDDMLTASENPTDATLFERKLEDMVDSIHHYDLSGMGAAAIEATPQFDKAPLEDIAQMTFPVDPLINDKVRTEMKKTTSTLPLVVNDVVLGYINYFNGKGRRTIEYGLERAGKYRPMIARILAEEGVPQELIHLAQAESGFLPRAVSRAAAEGMWQFVKFRGNEYGLMQTRYSDDRLDPEKATRAAARHLHDLYDEFHDWYLAIAAYNCGPGTVEKAVERTGYADYWELRARHALPAETTNYVPIILAMTIMAKNAPEYGLDRINPEAAIQYDTVQTSAPTSLALISDVVDQPISELQQLNPALLRGIAPEHFAVRVPKGTARVVTAGLEQIPAVNRVSWRVHRVEAGESLAVIARRYSSSTGMIVSANSLAGGEPNAGDRLIIPAAYRPEPSAPVRKTRAVASHSSKRGPQGQIVSSRRSSARHADAASTAEISAKHPVHRSAGSIAQVTHRARALNP